MAKLDIEYDILYAKDVISKYVSSNVDVLKKLKDYDKKILSRSYFVFFQFNLLFRKIFR